MDLEIISLLGGIKNRARNQRRASLRNLLFVFGCSLSVAVSGLHRRIGIPDSMTLLIGVTLIAALVFDVVFTHLHHTFALELEARKLNPKLVFVKMLFQNHPFTFLLIILIVCTGVFGAAIHLSEPDFSLATSLFLAFQTIVTGWPSDTFGTYNSRSAETKAIQLSLSIVSSLVFGIFLATVQGFILPSSQESAAISTILLRKRERAVRDCVVDLMKSKRKGVQKKNDARLPLKRAVQALKDCKKGGPK